MSDKNHLDIYQELQFLVARFANWFCGPAVLYWQSPEAWDEYIRIAYVVPPQEPT